MLENSFDQITPYIWPLYTAYFTPLNYYVYGTVDRGINITLCIINNELKARITIAFTNLNKETIEKASRRYWSRLETVIETNGDFFEST